MKAPTPVTSEFSKPAFASLPNGMTRYQTFGPREGQATVLIHGMTTPSVVWHALVPGLIGQGRSVISYDLYGRGLSARPTGRHDARLYLDQLTSLMDHLELVKPVDLIGYSMGGAIAQLAAARLPDRIARITLLASAGAGTTASLFYRFCADMPVLGDGLWAWRAPAVMQNSTAPTSTMPDMRTILANDAAILGTRAAWLSSLRHLLREDLAPDRYVIAAQQIPVTAIWGKRDPIIPPSAAERVARDIPYTQTIHLHDADHALAHTHPEAILASL